MTEAALSGLFGHVQLSSDAVMRSIEDGLDGDWTKDGDLKTMVLRLERERFCGVLPKK